VFWYTLVRAEQCALVQSEFESILRSTPSIWHNAQRWRNIACTIAAGLAVVYAVGASDVHSIVQCMRAQLKTIATNILSTVPARVNNKRASTSNVQGVVQCVAEEQRLFWVNVRRTQRRNNTAATDEIAPSSDTDNTSSKGKTTTPSQCTKRTRQGTFVQPGLNTTPASSTLSDDDYSDVNTRLYNHKPTTTDTQPPFERCVGVLTAMMQLDDDAVLPQGDYTFARYVAAAKDFRAVLDDHLPNKVGRIIEGYCKVIT
jgi:hypothetical protein